MLSVVSRFYKGSLFTTIGSGLHFLHVLIGPYDDPIPCICQPFRVHSNASSVKESVSFLNALHLVTRGSLSNRPPGDEFLFHLDLTAYEVARRSSSTTSEGPWAVALSCVAGATACFRSTPFDTTWVGNSEHDAVICGWECLDRFYVSEWASPVATSRFLRTACLQMILCPR